MVSLSDIQGVFRGRIRLGEPLAKYSVLGVGGPADYVLEARSAEEVNALVAFFAKHTFPHVVLCPNVIVSDGGFRGAVIIAPVDKQRLGVALFRTKPPYNPEELIRRTGLHGVFLGGAEVQGNCIINAGNASARDILALVLHVQRVIKQQTGTVLESNLEFVGFPGEELARVA